MKKRECNYTGSCDKQSGKHQNKIFRANQNLEKAIFAKDRKEQILALIAEQRQAQIYNLSQTTERERFHIIEARNTKREVRRCERILRKLNELDI